MSIADNEAFTYRGAWIAIQALWYSNGEEEVPIIRRHDYYGNLVSINDIQEWIEALEQYKAFFAEKDIQQHSLALRGNKSTAIEKYPDYEGLIECRRKQTIGYVYLVGAVDLGLFKIGCSKKPEYRLQQLSRQQIPSRLSMICMISTASMTSLEKDLHEKYKHRHKYGEWFELSCLEVEEIKLLARNSSDT